MSSQVYWFQRRLQTPNGEEKLTTMRLPAPSFSEAYGQAIDRYVPKCGEYLRCSILPIDAPCHGKRKLDSLEADAFEPPDSLCAFWSIYLYYYMSGGQDDKHCKKDRLAQMHGFSTFDDWHTCGKNGFERIQDAGLGLHEDTFPDVGIWDWEELKGKVKPMTEAGIPRDVDAFWALTSLYACQPKTVDSWLEGCSKDYTDRGVEAWKRMARRGYRELYEAGLGVPDGIAIPLSMPMVFHVSGCA